MKNASSFAKGEFNMEKSKAKELAEYITEQLAELESIRKTPMIHCISPPICSISQL
jgi:hypothetical protein